MVTMLENSINMMHNLFVNYSSKELVHPLLVGVCQEE